MRLALMFVAALALSQPPPVAADVVIDWNQQVFASGGPQIQRTLAMVHIAMFDAANAITPRNTAYLALPAPARAHRRRQLLRPPRAEYSSGCFLRSRSPSRPCWRPRSPLFRRVRAKLTAFSTATWWHRPSTRRGSAITSSSQDRSTSEEAIPATTA